ncbi:MAG TPA: hypothetical protein VKV20_00690 [Ktedonobacteraceae bacterium]|nr:hypothetical protein [Ktedonobacteraceae bacterium]
MPTRTAPVLPSTRQPPSRAIPLVVVKVVITARYSSRATLVVARCSNVDDLSLALIVRDTAWVQ